MTAPEALAAGCSPESRRRVTNPQGVPAVLADGRTWVLAHGGLKPALLALADEIYDDVTISQTFRVGAVIQAAWVLLLANYDLRDEELRTLLAGAETSTLSAAVLESLFGPERPRRTYTSWALSALYANGIEPSSVPPHLFPEVLHQLVRTGRAVPQGDYIDSASAMAQRAALLSMLPPPKPAPKPAQEKTDAVTPDGPDPR
jgi:hypothetical protein